MGQSAEELTIEIEGTRRSLQDDLDALEDKVSPRAVIGRRKEAARGRLSTMKDKVMGSGQHAAGSAKDSAKGAVSGAAGSVQDSASGAAHGVERKVEGSPLAAGLVAFGLGAVIAGLIPASDAEAQAADRLKDAARDHAQPVMEEAKGAAREMGENLKDSGTQAAAEVRDTAQESAARVKDEASSS
jgi:uncharacterized protein YjbJ (UPF0337 family)